MSRLLCKGDAAFVLDGFDSERPIGIAAGKNHADGRIAPICCERFEQRIGRHVSRGRARACNEAQTPIAHRKSGIRWNDVDVIGLDGEAFLGLRHRHRCSLGEEFRQQAFVVRIKMLDDDESHPAARGECGQQFRDRLETPRGGADADNREGH